ncbi:multidrug resistance protein [Venturia nashicola]|nr:multidrug resistance protein [Venturia nashicola]
MAAAEPATAQADQLDPKVEEEKGTLLTRIASSSKGSFLWFKLLFAVQPTWIDYLLIATGTICAVGAGVPFPLMGVLFGQIIDNFNAATCAVDTTADPFQYEASINAKVIQTAYIGAIAFALIYGHLTCWNIISQRLAHRMRVHYVSSLLRQPPSHFDTLQASGQVSSRLSGDITAIQAGTSEKVGNIITTISFFITVFIIAFTKQPRLAGILISMLPAFLLSGTIGSKYLSKYYVLQAAAVAKASSIASEALSHIAVVQAFGAAPRLEAKFSAHMATAQKLGVTKAFIAAIQTGLLYFIAYSGNALAFWQGSLRIADAAAGGGGGATVGEVYSIVYLIVDACVMLGGIAPSLPFLGAAIAAYERLKEEIEAPSAIDGTSDQGRILPPSKAKSISFRNVSFEYASRPGDKVLKNINVEFPAGKYTAIVGLSGSGKSTIAALIARLYDPTEGIVELDGNDIRQLNVRSLRSFISFVQQEPSLFNRSIFENIALGLFNSSKPEMRQLMRSFNGTDLAKVAVKGKDVLSYATTQGSEFSELAKLVQHAAEQADAASFIARLDEGYGTSAGESGTLISGGQRQRIALARALVSDPEILVLDEATSALDSASERKVQVAIEKAAAEQRTVISVAHRLSTIRNADNIVVMKAGQVVEQGTFDELVAKVDGEFASMARLQTLSNPSDLGSVSGNSLGVSTIQSSETLNEKDSARDSFERSATEKSREKNGSHQNEKEILHEPVKPFSSVVKAVRWLIRPYYGLLTIAISAAVLVGSTFSGAGIIFGFTVGELNPCSSTVAHIRERGRFFAGMYFLLAGVELVANFLTWWSFGTIAEKILYKLRVLSLGSLLEQSVHWHSSEERTPTSLLGIITKDSMSVSSFSGSTFGTVFAIFINIVVAIVVSNIFAWKIALVCMSMLPILLGAGFMQLRMLARYEERHQNAFTTATSLATEAVQSIRTVAVLSLEREYMESFVRLLAPPRKQVVQASATTNIWLAISYSTGIFINALAYWWGSQLVMRGEYTQTDFLIILVAMLTSAQLWSGMFALAPEFSRARLALVRVVGTINIGSKTQVDKHTPEGATLIADVESTAESKTSSNPADNRARGGAKVVFNNVTFSYPNRPDTITMDRVSFTAAPNQFIGLVGPSGAGKSTIMNLLQRLYTPTQGSILIDNQDISSMPTSFRDTVSIVPQDPTLFDGSVRFNVGLGAPPDRDATDAEIEEACRVVGLHDMITALPEGYDTECGPGAARLSGGQKQRIAIARALVRAPRLLLLDESTSALDAVSEAALQQGLKKASQHTTVIAIAHRLRTIREADMILVLEGGQVVDSGRHSELMERRESYRVNAMQQMLQ